MCCCLVPVFFSGSPIFASENEFQQWSTLSLGIQIDDLYSINILTQGRFAVSDDRPDLYVFRPSLHRKLADNLVAGIGMDYLKVDPGNPERRTWQEISYGTKHNRFSLKQRFRFEQRFLEDIKPIYRARYNLKAVYPLPDSRWSMVSFNEIFFNLNSRGRGPAPGLDQNRLFAGLGLDVSTNARVETGYLWRYLSRRDMENIHDHAVAIFIYFNL